jgi:hypothetical protein
VAEPSRGPLQFRPVLWTKVNADPGEFEHVTSALPVSNFGAQQIV